MFYIVNIQRPHVEFEPGTVEFVDILQSYILDVSELAFDQYQTFKGILFALDLLKELVPDVTSDYVVRFTPDE